MGAQKCRKRVPAEAQVEVWGERMPALRSGGRTGAGGQALVQVAVAEGASRPHAERWVPEDQAGWVGLCAQVPTEGWKFELCLIVSRTSLWLRC